MAVVVLSQYWGVSSFAISDLFYASQNLAVIFKVCSASRVNHLPQFCCCCCSRGYTNISCFFYFMFHNFHPQNLFKQAACSRTVKATIGAFFSSTFLQNKPELYRRNRRPFLFFFYICTFCFFGGFFSPGRVNATCPRGAARLVRVFFNFVCILTLC